MNSVQSHQYFNFQFLHLIPHVLGEVKFEKEFVPIGNTLLSVKGLNSSNFCSGAKGLRWKLRWSGLNPCETVCPLNMTSSSS